MQMARPTVLDGSLKDLPQTASKLAEFPTSREVALGRLSKSRGGTPTGERVPPDARRALSSVLRASEEDEGGGAEVGDTRLPAFRLPSL
jgi:hypothetical protein